MECLPLHTDSVSGQGAGMECPRWAQVCDPRPVPRYTCPFVEKFSIEIETYYLPDGGQQPNVFNLSGAERRQRILGKACGCGDLSMPPAPPSPIPGRPLDKPQQPRDLATSLWKGDRSCSGWASANTCPPDTPPRIALHQTPLTSCAMRWPRASTRQKRIPGCTARSRRGGDRWRMTGPRRRLRRGPSCAPTSCARWNFATGACRPRSSSSSMMSVSTGHRRSEPSFPMGLVEC